MKKRTKIELIIFIIAILLIGIWSWHVFNTAIKAFFMEDIILCRYDPVIEKIYDYKDKHNEFPASIDGYLREMEPMSDKSVKIYDIRYSNNSGKIKLLIECGYYGRKYEYIYQDPKNITNEKERRINNSGHEWVIIRGGQAK